MINDTCDNLIDFINNSPSKFHAIDNIKAVLEEYGFHELKENDTFKIEFGGKYYLTRDLSSIIAFKIGDNVGDDFGFNIVASHSDSPTFILKPNFEVSLNENYHVLDVEGYGGMIISSWLDRPLSIAGKVVVKEDNKIVSKLLNIDKDLLVIPNQAIHMNREINKGYDYNIQQDIQPIIGLDKYKKEDLLKLIAKELNVKETDILAHDLALYVRQTASYVGIDDEMVLSPVLDDLECAYTTLEGFLLGENEKNISVYAVFDNEEIGSQSKAGANSNFLIRTLTRIKDGIGISKDIEEVLASSFMVSSDNAHAVHPVFNAKFDTINRSYMNKGVVIKSAANHSYTTSSTSMAIFKMILEKNNVPYQCFSNRSDIRGGSTLGSISQSKVSIDTVDIGLPTLAMHSSFETGGSEDPKIMVDAIKSFYDCFIKNLGDSNFSIE